MAGGAVPADRKIDGADLSPLLLGRTKESPREAHYYFSGNRLEATLAPGGDFCRLPLEAWQGVLDLNLVGGAFLPCQVFGETMLAAGRGSIVNIGSLASITAMGRGHIAYSMAMGAVVQMTRELSTEWSGRGVRVNAILPAQVVNPGLEARMSADPGLRKKFLSGIPTGRLGAPEDIQGLAVFLASDASAWITGALIPMDGGNLAMNAGATRGEWPDTQGTQR